MKTMISKSSVKPSSPVMLYVSRPDGTTETLELIADKLLVIGNSSGCGLKLNGPGIAGTHCMLSLISGEIHVRDWNSELGTFINGQRVDHEAVASLGHVIQVGDFTLTTSSSTLGSKSHAPEASAHDETLPEFALASDASKEVGEMPGAETSPATEAASGEHARNLTDTWPMAFKMENSTEDEWVFDSDEEAEDESLYQYDSFQEDAIDLLQAEVDLLRTELAERDARLSELEGLADFGLVEHSPQESVNAADVEALAGRLEQLLAELEQSDERLSAMTELLRTSEDLNEAANEEREQLESWMAEIERRVSQREEDWQAERISMQRMIDELTQQRDRAEQHLSAKASQGGSGPEEYLRKLRLENTDLKSRIQRLEQDGVQMEQRLETSQTQSLETQVAASLEQAMRAERLQITQDKAALARERASVARMREELDQERNQLTRDPNSADHRIRAFREHLREIHENEPTRRKSDSMADRLGKLWRKLDGRPLDTD